MDNEQVKNLCLGLLEADTEEKVIGLLQATSYWNSPQCWRFYGDIENNFSTTGNQMSYSDAALAEKLVNAIDATLINEALCRGINPEGPNAPGTICEAVARFFEDHQNVRNPTAGRVAEWGNEKRRQLGERITLAATGSAARQGNPCFTIVDAGEGQTPGSFPDTLLSLGRSNKLRIPFVQGKFNMGGTGVLCFCGVHNLQFILSRRNPALLGDGAGENDQAWGFTVVRREDPDEGCKSSIYKYLAPLGSDKQSGRGQVLRFYADTLPIFPDGNNAYVRSSGWGTLIKLYEYSCSGFSKSNILLRGGLLRRLELRLAEPALPTRLYECRGYRGHEGSFANNLNGLLVRLSDDRQENLESGFPTSSPLRVRGEEMRATVYAFKKGQINQYRRNEGIIFTVNGQTHGQLTYDFFRRERKVGLSYLRDSLLVVVDCTDLSGRAKEDLIMNSRDRLRSNDLRAEVEEALEELLKNHKGLRELKERRRAEELSSKIDDAKPLEDILRSILRRNSTLASLFVTGNRLPNPFKTITVGSEESIFEGKRYPNYFKFKEKEYGEEIFKDCHMNLRYQLTFETDAASDYFSRVVEPGHFDLFLVRDDARIPVTDYVGPNLHNGIGTLRARLPEGASEGDDLRFVAVTTDDSRVDPFENYYTIHVKGPAKVVGGKGGRRKPPSNEEGREREQPSGIAFPKIVDVLEDEWSDKDPPFDKFTALRVRNVGEANGNGDDNNHLVYDFYVNIDNFYLKTELKAWKREPEILRARFRFGLVLLGLGMLQEHSRLIRNGNDQEAENDNNRDSNMDIEREVETVTRAVSPILLPMIDSLGGLDEAEIELVDVSGEAT